MNLRASRRVNRSLLLGIKELNRLSVFGMPLWRRLLSSASVGSSVWIVESIITRFTQTSNPAQTNSESLSSPEICLKIKVILLEMAFRLSCPLDMASCKKNKTMARSSTLRVNSSFLAITSLIESMVPCKEFDRLFPCSRVIWKSQHACKTLTTCPTLDGRKSSHALIGRVRCVLSISVISASNSVRVGDASKISMRIALRSAFAIREYENPSTATCPSFVVISSKFNWI